ncbi:hypothetical protein [Microtetraspora niveoalba]|uniref:hypothetical protein n=1 Tax=Microtetraspora niveoalba TaxID=46175 RepID=UPI0008336E04|nr:hypothetical protein [Microtetraspora niveoalba]
MFQQPTGGGDSFKAAEHLGRLVVIYAKDYRENIPTTFGASNAISADIHVVDAPGGPQVFNNALLFPRALVASLRDAVGGQPVLARIGQGVAKPGQSAPYILNPFSDQDAAVATAYVNSLPKPFQAAAPAPQSAPAAPAPVPAQAAPAPAAAAAAPVIDPNNLPADVAALLAQLQSQQAATA